MIQVHLLDTGHCRSWEHHLMTGGRRCLIDLPCMVALMRHPQHGWGLFDAGYSPRILAAVRKRFGTALLRWFVARPPLALSLLGIPWQQRREIEAQHPDGVAGYALDAVERALTQTPLRENYFWRGVLEGQYTPACCPEFLRPGEFARLKAGLIDRLCPHSGTLTEFLRATPEPVHKLSLLDHMDWMSGYDPAALAAEWSAILACCPDGARIVFRSAARQVRYLDAISVEFDGRPIRLTDALLHHPERSRELYARERTGIYGSFHVVNLQHGR